MTSEQKSQKRLSIVVSGRVQGVGYRFFTCEHARSFNFTGWVRNEHNGDVAMEVQGGAGDVYAFTQALEHGPLLSHVDDIRIREIPLIQGEKAFDIKY
jgi:acylphosphatase